MAGHLVSLGWVHAGKMIDLQTLVVLEAVLEDSVVELPKDHPEKDQGLADSGGSFVALPVVHKTYSEPMTVQ